MHIVYFHHALGLTEGVADLARALENAGHQVTTPDLYDGQVFTEIPDGLACADEIGTDELLARAEAAVAGLPDDIVLAGQSLGVFLAQHLFQTRPTAGALFISAFITPHLFAGSWPSKPAFILGADGDPFFVGDGDLQAARELAETDSNVHIELTEGETHLLTEPHLGATPEEAEWLATTLLRSLETISNHGADHA